MARIFICHSRIDRPFIDELIPHLRRVYKYENVWFDEEIHGGQIWWEEILNQIASCDIFLYLLSDASLGSPYCRAELVEAQRLRKPILTVQVRAETAIPPDISRIQYVDLAEGIKDSEAMAALYASVNRLYEKLPRRRPKPLWPERTPLPEVPSAKVEASTSPPEPPEHWPPTPPRMVQPSRLSESRAIVIGAIITGLFALFAALISSGAFRASPTESTLDPVAEANRILTRMAEAQTPTIDVTATIGAILTSFVTETSEAQTAIAAAWTATPTITFTPSNTPTETPSPTPTPTDLPTSTSMPSDTPTPTDDLVGTANALTTLSAETQTARSLQATSDAQATRSVPTNTPVPTSTPTETSSPTHTPTDTPAPTDTMTDTPTHTDTPTPVPTDTPTPTLTPSPPPSATPNFMATTNAQATAATQAALDAQARFEAQATTTQAAIDSQATVQARVTAQPCTVRVFNDDVVVRVGPGENRGALMHLPANQPFQVLGWAVASDGSLWWQLDKEEVAPDRLAETVWVAQGEISAIGNCADVGEAEIPVIVPFSSDLPEDTADNQETIVPAADLFWIFNLRFLGADFQPSTLSGDVFPDSKELRIEVRIYVSSETQNSLALTSGTTFHALAGLYSGSNELWCCAAYPLTAGLITTAQFSLYCSINDTVTKFRVFITTNTGETVYYEDLPYSYTCN